MIGSLVQIWREKWNLFQMGHPDWFHETTFGYDWIGTLGYILDIIP